MHKTPYTGPATIGTDAEDWLSGLNGYLRHPGPGELDRPALVVLDMQRYFLDPEAPAYLPASPAILGNVRRLVEVFREAGLPVVFTRHQDAADEGGRPMERWWGRRLESGSPWAELVDGFDPGPDCRVMDKGTYSAFRDTELDAFLADQGVRTLVLAGVQTHLCVETTAREAFVRGFETVVTVDGTAAPDLDLHLGSLRALGQGFARVVTAAAVEEALGPGKSSPVSRDSPDGPCPETSDLDVLVLGGGPAGIAAAIQTHRLGMPTRLVERGRPGGLINAALRVENYPGFPGGIKGSDLAGRFQAQARAVGVNWCRGEVVELERREGGFKAHLAKGAALNARVVVVATGTVPRRLGVPGEDALSGDHVFYRVDDTPGSSRRRRAIIVGGGDCALDQALHLWHRGYHASVLVRGRRPRALTLLSSRADEAGIEIRNGTAVESIRGDGGQLVLATRGPEGSEESRCDLVLVAVGRTPCLPPSGDDLKEAVATGADNVGRTSIPGLYLAGDCRRGWIRQTAVAVGDGVASAMDAWRYLETGKWK